ncbi:MAG: EMC3/TMCO1 family protein [archaeon]|nr:EMC3/TMCO1 family protein [archaeon]
MIINAMVDIAVISLVLAILSQIIQKKFGNKEEMKEKQKLIKEKQTQMKELMGKEDQKSKNELEALEKEMMKHMQEMMSGTMRMMKYSFVVFIPAFAILGFFYGEAIVDLPFAIPWLANGFNLFDFGTWGIHLYEQTNWYGWYLLIYLIIAILMNIGKKLLKNMGVLEHG